MQVVLNVGIICCKLILTARFVDRDMLMRFLGYGFVIKTKLSSLRPHTEVENQVDLEEDILDLQNMARIAQDMARVVPNTSNFARCSPQCERAGLRSYSRR